MPRIKLPKIVLLLLVGPMMHFASQLLDGTNFSALLVPIGILYWECFRKETLGVGCALKDLFVFLKSLRLVLKRDMPA